MSTAKTRPWYVISCLALSAAILGKVILTGTSNRSVTLHTRGVIDMQCYSGGKLIFAGTADDSIDILDNGLSFVDAKTGEQTTIIGECIVEAGE